MGNGESWLEEREKVAFLRPPVIERASDKLLHVDTGNRTITALQGRILGVANLMGDLTGITIMNAVAKHVQEAQSTVMGEFNSRVQFVEVESAEMRQQKEVEKASGMGELV